MADLLPPLLDRPAGPPPVTPTEQEPFDAFVTGFGATLLIGSQFLSKSAPHFAGKVFENVLGPEVAFGARKFSYPLPKPALLLAPAPLGFVPPEEYGLQPNYLAGINKFLHFQLGAPTSVGIPESSYLKTLPDTSPEVRLAQYKAHATDQRRILEEELKHATVEQIQGALAVTYSQKANTIFFDPLDIRQTLQVSLRIRLGEQAGNAAISNAQATGLGLGVLPRGYNTATGTSGAVPGVPSLFTGNPTSVGRNYDLFAPTTKKLPSGFVELRPPPNLLMQMNFNNAPPDLRGLKVVPADPG